MKKRLHLYFSGRVQGVGFRFTALELARHNCLKGWVKNLSDGRVEVLAEGEEEDLNSFLKSLKEEFKLHLADIEPAEFTSIGEFNNFQIKF